MFALCFFFSFFMEGGERGRGKRGGEKKGKEKSPMIPVILFSTKFFPPQSGFRALLYGHLGRGQKKSLQLADASNAHALFPSRYWWFTVSVKEEGGERGKKKGKEREKKGWREYAARAIATSQV